ncbi:TonB-dependent siderophore receptor [Pseudomonas sichuanensis]|uniref:TonB-dependent siderophore receptor n=1 Tax=Pseudomonas sichuanensis TaxID=2213015 RepID=UPI00244A86D3|nr:TonB-dependent siderophore receptor [Pseudomonas sichuanensis]MDH0730167.1 TonB-dependent siderophore receptor [Pseudomonas sichuanensis]MDH1581249.1 TonB-dependent siderophore receptor [Pseudomonas sichuanensis]MDH1593410.1 TonB-dependent siderophore receptor [Pseudomonas sichuanensis]MDH1597165.1 TonB-dependent siderophore receptor [Pseudomonas sichuanensis]
MRRISLISSFIVATGTLAKPLLLQAAEQPESSQPGVYEIPASDVTADAYYPVAVTEDSGSYTTGQTAAATRLPLTIKETPQSVTVVTRQRMDDQHLNSVKEVLDNTTGISPSTLDYRSSYYARGFKVDSFQYDGIPTTFMSGTDYLDTAFYDRVEVVRGSTGLLTGAGNPSASINLVRKRPTQEFRGELSLSAGSWDNYRGTIDLSGPLSETGKLRGRFIAVEQDAHSFIDGYTDKRRAYYGALAADLTDDTTVTVGYDYQNLKPRGMPWGGLPLFNSDGSRTDWSRSQTAAAPWSRWDNRVTTAFVDVEHRLDNDWTLRGVFNQGRIDYEERLFGVGSTVAADGSVSVDALGDDGKVRQNSFDVMASGPFTFMGREHEMVIGAMQSKRKQNDASTGYLARKMTLDPIADFGNYSGNYPNLDFDAAGFDTLSDSTIKQKGLYTVGRFSLADPLHLIIGGRFNYYEYESDSANNSLTKRKFVPYAGLIYDINDTYSTYVSYTSIFNPQTYRDSSGSVLAPTEGKTTEIGLKGEYLDGRLSASVAVFEAKLDNVAEQDPANRTPDGATAYNAVSGTKSKGFDIDIQGELTPNWNVFTGISHFTASSADGSRLNSNIPRTTAKLFTTYRMPGDFNKLTVGGGVNWQSRFYQQTTGPQGAVTVSQESYALASLMARYDVTEDTDVTLNVNNLFDKTYSTMTGFYGTYVYGAPRNASVTLRYRF